MAEEGVRDFQMAKRKALGRLDLPDRHLPSNEEIHTALAQHLNLFYSDRVARDLRRLRALAIEAMRFLVAFDPRLVGSVLHGTVTPESGIDLHLAANTPEEVDLLLQEHNIPHTQGERRLRFGADRYETFPTYCLTADGVTIELCVFTPQAAREPPLSPVDGRPMKRASLREVEALLDQ